MITTCELLKPLEGYFKNKISAIQNRNEQETGLNPYPTSCFQPISFETDTFKNGGSPRDLNPGPPTPQTRDHTQHATPVTLPGQHFRTHNGLLVTMQLDLKQFSSCYTMSLNSETQLCQGSSLPRYPEFHLFMVHNVEHTCLCSNNVVPATATANHKRECVPSIVI